jgi:hypothetical protein
MCSLMIDGGQITAGAGTQKSKMLVKARDGAVTPKYMIRWQ